MKQLNESSIHKTEETINHDFARHQFKISKRFASLALFAELGRFFSFLGSYSLRQLDADQFTGERDMDAASGIAKLVSGSIYDPVVTQFELILVNCSCTCHWKDHVNLITVPICRLETGVAPLIKGGDNGLENLAEVRYDGHIKLFLPAILSIACIMDMTMYPFDTQRCNLKFGE